MSIRAAPGPQLATGRLRVDAARAIAKLREYQLVDRTAWVLEAIRAAVASGARAITLTGDANDVWLAWEGEPWPAEELPRLFDELVSPEPTEERHHLRLLAAAVNSALGIDPAYVDVYRIADGETLCARYTPDVLVETAELEDSALRKVSAQPAEPPAGIAYATGMVVHLRRRAALGMLTYLFWHREPPELATARQACRDLAIEIAIGRDVLSRDRHGDLARLPLGGDLDGFVALCDPRALPTEARAAVLEIAEHGVVLARYPLPLAVAGGESPRGPVPVRVFVDARRMPTNASRSQVRRDVPPISTASQRAPALVATLIEDLAGALADPACDPRQRHAALALVAATISGPDWATLAFTEQLGPLAKVPLLRDAAGVPRLVGHPWTGHVYTGGEPVDAELGPWLSSMLWIPRGDPAAALVAGAMLDGRETRRRLAWAKQQRRAQRRFFAHAPRSASLTLPHPPRLRLALGARLEDSCVPPSWFAELTGELALVPERGDGEVLFLLQGRPLERVLLPSAIGFEAIVDAPVTPGDHFRAVARDAAFTLALRALRAALVCAAELIATRLAGSTREPPQGITEGADAPAHDERTIRAALENAHALQLRSPILAASRVWHTLRGGAVSLDQLAQGKVLGTTARPDLVPPAGRPVVVGGGQVLAQLLPGLRLVDYDHPAVLFEPAKSPEQLAKQLAFEQLGYALAVKSDGDGVRGAIAPTRAAEGSLHRHHFGHPLDRIRYQGTLSTFALAVDDDSLVPDHAWRGCAEAGPVRDFRRWEEGLLCTVLDALAGERSPALLGPPLAGLDNPPARWAFAILHERRTSPQLEALLAPALRARLVAAPLVHLLGERDLVPIAELAKQAPATLYYVGTDAAPVPGFAPMVASSAHVAEVVGLLAGRRVADGHARLDELRAQAAREARLARHRSQEVRPLVFPTGEPHTELVAVGLRGLIGVGHDRMELELRIEGRLFETLIRSEDLPLQAVLELDLALADQELSGVADPEAIVARVKQMLLPVLRAVITAQPHAIADPTPARTLLTRLFASNEGPYADVRALLADVPAFPTIQGARISIAAAAHPNGVVRTSAWNGTWVGPAPAESPSALDEGVLQVLAEDLQLAVIVDKLARGHVVDVGDQVSRLQANRRMAQGMIPIPALPHVPAHLKRTLAQLGDIGARLGHGEIGLVESFPEVLLHDHGVLRQSLSLEIAPPIQLAIEAPELIDHAESTLEHVTRSSRRASAQLVSDAQRLALQLLREVVASGCELPRAIRNGLRRDLLARRLDASVLGALRLFELADGTWVTSAELDRQLARFGDVWVVTAPTSRQPLDDQRRVFLMTADDMVAARGVYKLIDASMDLELDHKARRNRERPPVATLEPAEPELGLARLPLEGDGTTTARGWVMPLLPQAAGRRGVIPHREMVPLAPMPDPCRWPTLAVIDDARLEPDRAWERPVVTNTWIAMTLKIAALCDRALAELVPPVEGALAHLQIKPDVPLGPHANKLVVRGAVGLLGAPRAPRIELDIFDAEGHHAHVPARALGIGGTLYVHAPEGWDREAVLADVLPHLYGQLVLQLLQRAHLAEPPSDLLAAHAATALALRLIKPADVGPLRFTCMRPELDATALMRMFDSESPVAILPIAELDTELISPDAEGIIEDGSELSQAVIAQLGARASSQPMLRRSRRRPVIPPPPARPVVAHPIQEVIDAVCARLANRVPRGFEVRIADVAIPLSGSARGLVFAGREPRLLAIAEGLRTSAPWAPLAIEALCAHAITVLDDALSEVNQQTVREVLGELLTS